MGALGLASSLSKKIYNYTSVRLMKKIIESVEAGLMTKSEIISINLHSFIKKII